ncbi:hypothetical protein HOE425_331316 [Hoeflea sp. EC-HK425]|nr:hypothetical protein HOE425_331316 [Hoeflea sp. EC-HK425]
MLAEPPKTRESHLRCLNHERLRSQVFENLPSYFTEAIFLSNCPSSSKFTCRVQTYQWRSSYYRHWQGYIDNLMEPKRNQRKTNCVDVALALSRVANQNWSVLNQRISVVRSEGDQCPLSVLTANSNQDCFGPWRPFELE